MNSYERSIYNSLLKFGVSDEQVSTLLLDFYPIVYKLFRGEVEPGEYVNMLMGVIEKGLTLDDVKKIVYGCDPKERRITRVFPTVRFKLLLEFDDVEYRITDIKELLMSMNSPILAAISDIELFKTATVDKESGTVVWDTVVVGISSDILFENSYPISL